ncbi:MAG: tetratricopeptide repeat protein [Polyangiaceae bacterium]
MPNQSKEGVTQLALDATVQPTKRVEGTSSISEIYDQAGVALNANDSARAEQLYRQAAAVEPASAQPYIGLGSALLQSGDIAGARAAYRDALARSPDSPSAHLGLGSVENQSGNYQQAIDEYQLVLRAKPDDADAHWGLAVTYRSLGDAANASSHAKQFLTIAPNSPLVPQMRLIVRGE